MVAPSYAAQRSALAKQIGLGRKPAAEEPAAPEPVPAAKEPRRRAAGRGKVAV
jgi:predicted transcriptional regulator